MLNKLIKIIIAGILTIFILSPVAVFYSYAGAHQMNPNHSTDVKWYPYQWKGTMAEGIAFMRLDNNGFNNNFDLNNEEVNILLMGSSHMEALQVAQSQNTGALLNEYLPEYTTYNISISGHTIYHCIDNLESAIAEYSPTDYIIIETMDLDLDPDAMQAATSHNRSRLKSSKGGSYYLARYLPGLNTLYQKITNWRNTSNFKREVTETNTETVPFSAEQYTEALDSFLTFAKNVTSENDCKLIILYHPTMELSQDGALVFNADSDKATIFHDLCQTNDIIFVDASDIFLEMYEQQHLLPSGFSNTKIAEGHLNKYGHNAIATLLADTIKADSQ